jgi:hypothetical protein
MTTNRINVAGVQYVCDHLANIPRPDREVERAIKTWLLKHNVHLPPEQIEVVTLHVHRRTNASSLAVIVQRASLVQAVLMNWQGESNNNLFGGLLREPWAGTLPQGKIEIVEALPPAPFNVYGEWYSPFNGLFRRTESSRYDHSTLLALGAETLQSHIEEMDFHTQYRALLDTYWRDHLQSYRLASKLNFIAACNQQVDEGSLSDAGRRLIWRAAELLPRGEGMRMSMLNIYGYCSTDLLCINDNVSDLTVLYIPGNSSPLLEFASEVAMKDWVGQQCKTAPGRQALKQHFKLADGPLGLDFSGLDIALEGLGAWPLPHRLSPNANTFATDGFWPPRKYVDYRPEHYNAVIDGDPFLTLAERQKQRGQDDADFIITSNAEVSKARWLGYLNATLNLIAPLTLVVPGLGPLLALGGIVQFGLGLDQVINGKHLEDKSQGLQGMTWGLLNAMPLAVQGITRGKALFETRSDAFVAPARVNDQIGYPLSPVSPPRLPDLEAAPYFHIHDPVPPLAGGEQAIADTVIRVPQYDGGPDNLDTRIDGYNTRVIYDMQRDAFITEDAVNEVDPVGYTARPGSGNLQPLEGPREVSDAMRMRSLRALGVDLPLPVAIPTLSEASTPIPKQISCLWVGDKVLSPVLIRNLARNTARLQDSDYTLRLFLSNVSDQAYAENLRLLAEQAPGLQVLPLEEQGFFRVFRDNKPHHFAQYQAALDGNNGVATNFASASDVLRYPMLHHEGGLYMDVDDSLFDGTSPAPLEHIDQVPLRTTPDGLLLPPPMSNEKMSMNCLYNTSLIGSHAGNPTLLAISEEMHARFQANADFYDSRPDLREDPRGFYLYAGRLSRLTGPALLSDVIDQRLPALRTMRQIMNLYAMPRINAWQFIDLEHYQQSLRDLLPLNRFARVGQNHSWAKA